MEKTIESKYVYKGKILNLRVDKVELENGKASTREIVEHKGAVAIIAIDGDCLLMVKQFRKAIEKDLLEIPAGKIENEDPLNCAIRELKEETGYTAAKWNFICEFYSTPGFSNEKIYLYCATDLAKGEAVPDEDEFIKIERLKMKDAIRMLKNGEFHDAKTIIGLYYAITLMGVNHEHFLR